MSNGSGMEPAGVDHVSNTVTGVIVGGLAATAVVIAAPILLPALGLAALGTSTVALIGGLPWAGAAIGGWMGWNKAAAKAAKYGVRG